MRLGILAVGLLLACQGSAPPQGQALTDSERTQIEAAVRAVVDTVWAAARAADFGPILAHSSPADGLCVWQAEISSCKAVREGFEKAWSASNPDRPQRQEMDGQEIRVDVLSPTVAVVASTIRENRAYAADGKVYRGRFASLFVYVLENGSWKAHSGQQASWPIDSTAGR